MWELDLKECESFLIELKLLPGYIKGWSGLQATSNQDDEKN